MVKAELCRLQCRLLVGTSVREAGHNAPLKGADLRRQSQRAAPQQGVTPLCAPDGLRAENAQRNETKSEALGLQKSMRSQTGVGAKCYPRMRFTVLLRPLYPALVVRPRDLVGIETAL